MSAWYDALVLYKNDDLMGIYDEYDEIAKATGFSVNSVKQRGQRWYHEEYDNNRDQGKHTRNGYLIQCVRL